MRSEPIPGGELLADVPYGRRPAQRLDLYRPLAATRCPVLVIVHGGAWALGDKANAAVVDHKVAHWLPRGWVVVSLNYRLLPWAGPMEQAADVARALALVQRRIGEFGGDPQRIALMAHSSGAHLAALLLADPGLGAEFGLQPVRCAVLLDGAALDVPVVMEGEHLPLHERAFGDDRAFWREASPRHRLKAVPAPVLLLCSQLRDDSLQQSEAFADAVSAIGGSARVKALPLMHAEFNALVGQPGELTDAIDAFLAEHGLT